MRLKPVKEITYLLFREMIRDKIFLSLSGASVVLILASLILNQMVVGQEIKATKDLGLSVLNLFSLFILIFLGINLVSRDLNSRSLYFLFAKPVTRSQYLIGSGLSILWATMAGIVVISATIILLSLLQAEVWIGGVLIAGYLTLLEMMVLLSFAVLFALVTSPQLAMFLTLLTYVIGHTIQHAAQIVDRSANILLKYFVLILSGILPDLEFFNKKPEIIYNLDIPFSYFVYATVYSLSYTLLIFLLAYFLFQRKEI